MPRAALAETPNIHPHYFFWSGNDLPKTAVADWQRSLRTLDLANFAGAHPHRFRDTFTVELLLAGVPIDQVSILLGHSSVKITERSYAPWVKTRQEQLEAAVMKAWDSNARQQMLNFEVPTAARALGLASN